MERAKEEICIYVKFVFIYYVYISRYIENRTGLYTSALFLLL